MDAVSGPINALFLLEVVSLLQRGGHCWQPGGPWVAEAEVELWGGHRTECRRGQRRQKKVSLSLC